jgi:asparagine synthase (glutamine-hydrolysing)
MPLLRGMFSFVIYDQKTKIVFGARDRMGIKPFLYSINPRSFVFASELNAIKSSGLVDSSIEMRAVRQLFLYGSIQFPYTLQKEVLSLPPAHYFYYIDCKLQIISYWNFPTEIDSSITFEQAKNKFSDKFEQSVQLRLLSDRKLGIFLSAGLDSVSILAALKKLNKSNIETFTIGFAEKHEKFNSEIDRAEKLANYFSFANTAKQIKASEVSSDVKDFMRIIDQPSVDGFNTYIVSKESQSELTVALSGLGGDELMLGYPRNVNLYNKIQANFKLSSSISDKLLIEQLYASSASKNIARVLKYLGNPRNLKLHYWSSRLINKPEFLNAELFHSDLAQTCENDMSQFYAFDNQQYSGDPFNTISYYEMRTFMMNQLLRDMDVASMANGIEVRFPFLDHKLVEFVFSLPAHFKYRPQRVSKNNKTGSMTYSESGVKYVLAQAYADSWPNGFLETNKQGFQLPIQEWFKNSISEDLSNKLADIKLKELGFNAKMLTQMQVSLRNGQFNNNHYLMNILLATL